MKTLPLLTGAMLGLAALAAPYVLISPSLAQSGATDLSPEDLAAQRLAERLANLPVTSEGYEQLSYGKTFYIEVPMIDEPPLVQSFINSGDPDDRGGIGSNITAESIINDVRYASDHPEINHVVFMMRTGGGAMFHAEAMMHIIEDHHHTTEFHIIIDDAISAGTWTVFSSDNVYIVEGGSVGGAVIYVHLPDGTVKESPEIPFVAARMSKLAERNGHNGLFLPAMMHLPAELHYWEEGGQPVLSATAPSSSNLVENYELIDSDEDVLTLTSEKAVRCGLAELIEDFNAEYVGEHIGAPGWTLANHYGQVVHEIGDVYNVTRVDQDLVEQVLDSMPYFRDTRENRENSQIAAILEDRAIFERLLDGYEKVNEALNNLPYVHPERHAYLTDEQGRTILADPEQWDADVRASRAYARMLTSSIRDMHAAARLAEYDTDNINSMEEAFRLIADRIDGIARQGNAAYWAENKVEMDIE